MAGLGHDTRSFGPEERDLVRRYTDAMTLTLDRAIGSLLEHLKAKGIYDDTIIAFTADHGDYLCDHGCLRKSNHAAEQLLHLPCIIRDHEGRLPASIDGATSNVDLFPTFCDLAGVPPVEH